MNASAKKIRSSSWPLLRAGPSGDAKAARSPLPAPPPSLDNRQNSPGNSAARHGGLPRRFDVARTNCAPACTVAQPHRLARGHSQNRKQAANRRPILAEIRPLDIVCVSSKGRKSGPDDPQASSGHARDRIWERGPAREAWRLVLAESPPPCRAIEADPDLSSEADSKRRANLSSPSWRLTPTGWSFSARLRQPGPGKAGLHALYFRCVSERIRFSVRRGLARLHLLNDSFTRSCPSSKLSGPGRIMASATILPTAWRLPHIRQ